ncbi:MAG: UpxY family transcription antiterminator [Edaphobacter sp.]
MPEIFQHTQVPPLRTYASGFDLMPQPSYGESAWFAAHVRSKHEFTVAEQLSAKGIEHYLPAYHSLRQWSDRKVWLDLPLFPCYLFVRISWADRLNVLNIPGVLSMLGSAHSHIHEETIDSIRQAIKLNLVEPCRKVEPGDRVKILSGLFEGTEGTLLRSNGSARLVIYVKDFSQPFVVQTPLTNLRKI